MGGEESLNVDYYPLSLIFARSQSPQDSGRLEVREAEAVRGAGVGEQRPLRAADERHAVARGVVLLDSKPVANSYSKYRLIRHSLKQIIESSMD